MLSRKRKTFIKEHIRLSCRDPMQAAINAGYKPKTAASYANRILNDPDAIAYLGEKTSQIRDQLREDLLFDAVEARQILIHILQDENAKTSDRISAAKDLLDRAGFKNSDKTETPSELKTNISKLDDILQQINGGSI